MTARNRTFFLGFLAAFFAGLAGLAAVNLTVDADGMFDRKFQQEAEVARLLGTGTDVITSGNFRAPLVNRLLIDHWDTAPATIAIGSSRVLEVDAAMTPGYQFYNHGGTSSRLAHMLAIFGAYERRNHSFHTVIISAEHWMFSHESIEDSLLDGAMDDLRLMASLLDTTPSALGVVRRSPLTKLKALISASLARRSLAVLTSGGAGSECPELKGLSGGESTPCPVKRHDGSFKYPQAVEAAGTAEVEQQLMVELGRRGGLYMAAGIDRIDPAKLAAFEAMLAHLQQRGTRVVLMLSPFHPMVATARKHAREWADVGRIEHLVRQVADRHGIEVRGSYDAAQAGCGAGEFYDAVHPRRDCIARILANVMADAPTATLTQTGPPVRD